MAILLDRFENPPARKPIDKIIEVEKPVETIKTVEVEKLVEVEKTLEVNQLLLTLSDAEHFALRETVLGFSDFAERQNKIIESLSPENKPFFSGAITHSPEIFNLWVRNRVITKKMSEAEREDAIKFNMGAYLQNMFLVYLVNDRISESMVTPEILMEYIQAKANPEQAEQ